MILLLRWLLAGLILLCVPGITGADAVDDYIESQRRTLHIPGLSLAVVRDGQVIKSRGYGLASIELDTPATEDSVFEIGSVTKQFTAAALMMLVEEGKVGLDEPMSRYLTGVPEAWRAITVRHLLTHSSGIENYLAVPTLPDTSRPGLSHDEIARIFFEGLKLELQPGETWSYSNTGYLLLGNILEKASGKSYWEFLDERIFKPLGMAATRSSEPRAIIPKRAAGYHWQKDRIENRPALTENAYAAGSIVSTIRDLAKWDAALSRGELLRPASFAQMWTPSKARGGRIAPANYGFGWFIDTYHGRRVIAHTGGTPGFSSAFYRFVDDRLSVILLTNHSDRIIDHLAIDIAGLYVPALARPKGEGPDPGPETSRKLKTALVGLFAGQPDPALFTPAMQAFLQTGTGQGLWPWAGSDGPLQSFTFSEKEEADGHQILRYKAVLGNATLWFSFTLSEDGRIAQITWW